MSTLSSQQIGFCLSLWLALPACNAKRLDLFEHTEIVVSNDDTPGGGRTPDSSSSNRDAGALATDDDDGTAPAAGPNPSTSASGSELDPSQPSTTQGPEPAGPDTGSAGSQGVPRLVPTPGPSPSAGPSGMSALDASVAAPEPEPAIDAGNPNYILIDDFEDNNLQASASASGGWWYPTTDTTAGTFVLETVPEEDRPGSAYVLHVAGHDFTDWGVIVGIDLRGETGSFDARPTNAVQFAARAAEDRVFILRLLQPDGGSYTTQLLLTTEWTVFSVPFDTFVGAGDAGTVDASTLGHLHFYFGVDPFEAWIDDVAFVTQ